MTENKTKYTPSEAIRAISGMTRKRFYEMLKNGDISYTKENWGNKERRVVDGSELARVFPNSFKTIETEETTSVRIEKQKETTGNNIENKMLEQEVKFLNEKINDKEKQLIEKREYIENLSQKLDKAQETIERQTYLIENYAQKSSEQKKEEIAPKKQDQILLWLLPLITALGILLTMIALKNI